MLADAVRRVLESLDAPYCLIGAHALAVRGYPRFTLDRDFFTSDEHVLQREVWHSIESSGATVDPRRGDFDDPLSGVVHISINVEYVDVVVAKWKWELEVIMRAQPVDVGGMVVPVPRASDLILLKLAAGGPIDIQDAIVLLSLDRQTLLPEVEEHIGRLRPDAQAEWRKLVTSTATSG